LCQGFDTRAVLDPLRQGRVTVFPGVPSAFEMLASLSDGPSRLPGVRLAYSAGSVLPMSVFEACRRRWGLRVGQLYGSSEVGSVTFNDPTAGDHDPLSAGRPMTDVVAVVVEPGSRSVASALPPGVEGELAVHAPSMLHGYVGEATSPLVEGFFFTGDLARIDTRGAVTVTGRIKLLIDVGATKVNPLEVEEVLAQHEGVRECVVLPVPVTDTVSRLRAVVVPEDRAAPPSAASLRRFVRARLSAHKVPRLVDVVESLPKSPTGKLLRRPIAS
jgi:long-chain acyl-CoA synthetase